MLPQEEEFRGSVHRNAEQTRISMYKMPETKGKHIGNTSKQEFRCKKCRKSKENTSEIPQNKNSDVNIIVNQRKIHRKVLKTRIPMYKLPEIKEKYIGIPQNKNSDEKTPANPEKNIRDCRGESIPRRKSHIRQKGRILRCNNFECIIKECVPVDLFRILE